MRLNRLERETTITFNEVDKNCLIFSASQKIKNKLSKLGFKPYKTCGEGKWFMLPKNWIGIRPARNK